MVMFSNLDQHDVAAELPSEFTKQCVAPGAVVADFLLGERTARLVGNPLAAHAARPARDLDGEPGTDLDKSSDGPTRRS